MVLPDEAEREWADRDAGEQVAEDGAEAEPLRDRHREDRRAEVHEREEEEALAHASSSWSSVASVSAFARSTVPSRNAPSRRA